MRVWRWVREIFGERVIEQMMTGPGLRKCDCGEREGGGGREEEGGRGEEGEEGERVRGEGEGGGEGEEEWNKDTYMYFTYYTGVYVLYRCKSMYIHVQWNLCMKDTLGPWKLSFIERLNYTRKY